MSVLDIKIVPRPSPHWEVFKILYRDFEKSFEFIHPTPAHFKIYSFRYYDYLLRACTEFESICKGELIQRGLAMQDDKLSMMSYAKLEGFYHRKLSSYEVGFLFEEIYFVRPFGAWAANESLNWYKDYNLVKHSRRNEFFRANMDNVLKAIAALFVVLIASKLAPEGTLALGGEELLRWHDEWPMVIRKDEGNHVYNS